MSQAAKAQEPSMEEILASIRRIIADDETQPGGKSPAANSNGAAGEHAASTGDFACAGSDAMSQDDIENMLDDLDAPAEQRAEAHDASSSEEEADVLELTPAMEATEPDPEPAFRSIDGHQDIYFGETARDPEPPRSMQFEHQFNDEGVKQLLSDQATAAVTSAFGSLAHTVLAQNARTLDDLVREMLRPMLKTWLDDNLPMIVERLVRAEIERVSRGRG